MTMTDISGSIRTWPAKAPGAALDYTADLTSWLAQAPGDPLASVTVVSVTPSDLIVVKGPDISGAPLVVIWLGGGTHETEYAVVLAPVTDLGRTDAFVFLISVIDPFLVVSDRIGAGMAAS
jgi:hypothetical protein